MSEVALLIGLQAAGKSTFRRSVLGARAAVSKDDMGRNARNKEKRQLRLVDEALQRGEDLVVDNTNASRAERAATIEVAKSYGATVTAYWFPPDVRQNLARNATRTQEKRVPDLGVLATLKRLEPPCRCEGFDRVNVVRFDGHGGFTVQEGTPTPCRHDASATSTSSSEPGSITTD